MEVIVMKRILGVLFVLVVLQCVLCGPSAAQSCIGKFATQIWEWPYPIPSGWYYFAPSPEPFAYLIASWTGSCPPPSHCSTCDDGSGNGGIPTATRPINLTNGNTYVQESDVRLPGLGGGLTLQRTWNSMWPAILSGFQTGMFGPNWRSTYEERVFTGSGEYTGYMVYLRADGSLWVFAAGTGSTWNLAAPANVVATLTQNGTQSWKLAFQNGEQRVFSYSSGSLTSIIDRNGNTSQLSYDGSNRLTTVTDPASRTLTFTYANSSFPNVVTSLGSSTGISLSYSYDTQGRLNQFTKPDLTTVTFTYNTQSLITAVTDSNGKTLESHTYDSSGRGLTGSRANGVEAVTITYPQ
jgi:YD repeat-containing protein